MVLQTVKAAGGAVEAAEAGGGPATAACKLRVMDVDNRRGRSINKADSHPHRRLGRMNQDIELIGTSYRMIDTAAALFVICGLRAIKFASFLGFPWLFGGTNYRYCLGLTGGDGR